jgi:hypothetical protein
MVDTISAITADDQLLPDVLILQSDLPIKQVGR